MNVRWHMMRDFASSWKKKSRLWFARSSRGRSVSRPRQWEETRVIRSHFRCYETESTFSRMGTLGALLPESLEAHVYLANNVPRAARRHRYARFSMCSSAHQRRNHSKIDRLIDQVTKSQLTRTIRKNSRYTMLHELYTYIYILLKINNKIARPIVHHWI